MTFLPPRSNAGQSCPAGQRKFEGDPLDTLVQEMLPKSAATGIPDDVESTKQWISTRACDQRKKLGVGNIQPDRRTGAKVGDVGPTASQRAAQGHLAQLASPGGEAY